jgi:hypothetical protein
MCSSIPKPQPELDEVQIKEKVESLAEKRPATKRFLLQSEEEEEEEPAKKRGREPKEFCAAAPASSSPSRYN